MGVNFKEHIAKFVDTSCTLLIIIGDKWVNKGWARQQSWFRLRERAEDFVQSEIELALDRGVPLLPILVDGVAMPSSRLLPNSILAICNLNAASVRSGRDFHSDMDAVMARIRPLHMAGKGTKQA